MDVFMAFWDILINNYFRNPPLLLGSIAAVGLSLQKKAFEDVFKGAALAALGLFMLQEGAGLITGSFLMITTIFRDIMGAAPQPGLDAASFVAEWGSYTGMAMFFGLILHLLIAKFTPVKTIFLTGHFLWWFPVTFVGAGVEAGFTGAALVIFGSVCSALYWSFAPLMTKKYVQDVTGDKWLLGHPSGIFCVISGTVAKYVGDKSRTSNDLKIPKRLSFLREIPITGFFVIFAFYIVLNAAYGGIVTYHTGTPIFTYALNMGMRFGVGILVLLNGVRMLINQIVPAFEGLSTRLIPNAVPAFDCPLLFGYRPNAVIIGFLIAIFTTIPLLAISNHFGLFGTIILVPAIVICFFEMGTAAIIADGQGGVRGMFIGTFVAAFFVILFGALGGFIYANTAANRMILQAGDQAVFGAITSMIGRAIAPILGFVPLPLGG